ncbi:hypothetical protein SAY86_014034 [Trapa natans]|uniref:heme oxygenase (biliverdin-producing) n=1 Tax=Trapa natans TaxID=22666 RepID=A0AAN7KVM5_TRANT|nr:hypothetical protein SAY86_014034 [Trapa natans]
MAAVNHSDFELCLIFTSDTEFIDTGPERWENLAKDLEWFRCQGHTIPEPSDPGTCYARLLEDLSEKDPQAFICHLYNIYFAHSAGDRMIGKKVMKAISSDLCYRFLLLYKIVKRL